MLWNPQGDTPPKYQKPVRLHKSLIDYFHVLNKLFVPLSQTSKPRQIILAGLLKARIFPCLWVFRFCSGNCEDVKIYILFLCSS